MEINMFILLIVNDTIVDGHNECEGFRLKSLYKKMWIRNRKNAEIFATHVRENVWRHFHHKQENVRKSFTDILKNFREND